MSDTYTLDNRTEEYIYADERAEYMKLFFSKQNKTIVDYRHLENWGMLVVTTDRSIYKVIAEDRIAMRVEDTYAHIVHVYCTETVNKVLDAYVTIDRVQCGLPIR